MRLIQINYLDEFFKQSTQSINQSADKDVCKEGAAVMELNVGNVIKLKKKHPCGSSEWEILRVGADFRLKCLGCGHQIMVSRKLVEKNTKEIRKKA